MATLYFIKEYNNYYNRIIKRNSFEYITENYDYENLFNINFNPNNNIETEQIVNWSNSWTPDYMLEVDNDEILSRWFVISWERTRRSQYKVSLKRDLLADNYNDILNCPMIINRGMVNWNNPLIFNDEGFTFNQIKQSETLLTDTKHAFPWLVLYMQKGFTSISGISVNISAGGNYDEEIPTLLIDSEYESGEYISKTQSINLDFRFKAQYSTYGYTGNWRFYIYNTDANSLVDDGGAPTYTSVITNNIISNNATQLKLPLDRALDTLHMRNVLDDIKDSETSAISDTTMNEYEDIINAGSKIIKDSSGKIYRITIRKEQVDKTNVRIKPGDAGYTRLVNYIKAEFPDFTPNDDAPAQYAFYPFYSSQVSYKYTVNAEYLVSQTFTVDVNPQNKQLTNDNECTVLLLPYEDLRIVRGNNYYDISKQDQLSIARSIAKEYTTSVCYDMQLLPYAPTTISNIFSNRAANISNVDSSLITEFDYNTSLKGIMFWADVSSFSFDIAKSFVPTNTAESYKIATNCDIYRLCSPNYNGQFEFNAAKNNGVTSFNIDVTYKPYNPYIHVNPNFKGLYGQDFNDARGLICQGDFSIPIEVDKWAEYELQNKNYLNVFNREIQHMDFENKVAQREAIAGAIVGTLQGGIAGAGAGAMSGGGAYGAIAGAITGTATSGVGGILDYQYLKERQKENKDYAIDMFNYQLGNIKALPYSLNKVNPFTWNNKIFPFIEYYSCTEQEKEILRNSIRYRSMKLEIIDTKN